MAVNFPPSNTLLKYILNLDLSQCAIDVCIASGEADDKEYTFRRIKQSDELAKKFGEAITSGLEKYREAFDDNNIELQSFTADTVKSEQEIEYLNILPYDSIKRQIEPVEHYLRYAVFQA